MEELVDERVFPINRLGPPELFRLPASEAEVMHSVRGSNDRFDANITENIGLQGPNNSLVASDQRSTPERSGTVVDSALFVDELQTPRSLSPILNNFVALVPLASQRQILASTGELGVFPPRMQFEERTLARLKLDLTG